MLACITFGLVWMPCSCNIEAVLWSRPNTKSVDCGHEVSPVATFVDVQAVLTGSSFGNACIDYELWVSRNFVRLLFPVVGIPF